MQPLLLSTLLSKQKTVVMSSWNDGDMKLTWAKRPDWIFTFWMSPVWYLAWPHCVLTMLYPLYPEHLQKALRREDVFFSVRMEMWGNIKGKRKLLAWYPTCSSWVEVVRRFIKNCLLQDGFWGKSVTHETFSVKESSEHIWEASTCQDLCIISCSVDISIAIL